MSNNIEKVYQVRYNTQSTDDSNRWRLLCDGQEILVANIVINSQTFTTKDYIKGVGDKWHVTCRGELTIENNTAYINFKKDNAIARHLAKTITWRKEKGAFKLDTTVKINELSVENGHAIKITQTTSNDTIESFIRKSIV